MSAESTLALFSRWFDHGDRDDLLVALDGLSEMNVHFSHHEQSALRLLAETPRRIPRRERARSLAPIVWNLVHQLPDQWRSSVHELRMLLALALRVRQQIRDPKWIVGGDHGYINLTGLSWWAGLREERTSPRIATIGRFVDGGSAEEFRQNLIDDVAHEARRRQRNATQRTRRERGRNQGLQLRVYGYDSGHVLVGTPSAELIRQSADVPSGAVSAFLDSDFRWQYVAPQDVRQIAFRGLDIIRVYVA